MACSKGVHFQGSALSSSPSPACRRRGSAEGASSSSSTSYPQCGSALIMRGQSQTGRLPRLKIICKKGHSKRTSTSHLRPMPSSLQRSEDAESSSQRCNATAAEAQTVSSNPQVAAPVSIAEVPCTCTTLPQTPTSWQSSTLLKAKEVSLHTIAAMRSKAKAIVCSEEAVPSVPTSGLPLAAGVAAVAVVGYFVSSLMFNLAHHIVSGFGNAISQIRSRPDDRFLLETGDSRRILKDVQMPEQLPQPGSQVRRGAVSGPSLPELLRSNRGASLVPSSKFNKTKAAKRVPLVVSAASPSAIYEQSTEESEWLKAEPLGKSSLQTGGKFSVSKQEGRTPLVVSAAAPNTVYAAAEEGIGHVEVFTGQEITLKAILDPTWVPTVLRPVVVDILSEEPPVTDEAITEFDEWKPKDAGDETVALAASIAAQQMLEMEKAQDQQVAALKRAAESEAKLLEERHRKQLAALQAQLSAARKEASIASTIAKHFLESDASNVVTIKKGESATNGALPGQKPAAPKAPQMSIDFEDGALKFGQMSNEMRELVRSFNSVLEMKLSKESAHRQAVEERLREAEMEHRILKGKLEEALTQATVQSLEKNVLSEPATETCTESEGSPALSVSLEAGHSVEQGSGTAHVTDLRHKLAHAQASLFRERLRAEDKQKMAFALEARLERTVREREALRLESFQKTANELAAAQELLAAQAKANLEMTSALQQLMEEPPVLQAQLAEARLQLEKEREARKEELARMKVVVMDARAEAAALRVESVRMEEQYVLEIEQLQHTNRSETSFQ